jgi:hypothetical protein
MGAAESQDRICGGCSESDVFLGLNVVKTVKTPKGPPNYNEGEFMCEGYQAVTLHTNAGQGWNTYSRTNDREHEFTRPCLQWQPCLPRRGGEGKHWPMD